MNIEQAIKKEREELEISQRNIPIMIPKERVPEIYVERLSMWKDFLSTCRVDDSFSYAPGEYRPLNDTTYARAQRLWDVFPEVSEREHVKIGDMFVYRKKVYIGFVHIFVGNPEDLDRAVANPSRFLKVLIQSNFSFEFVEKAEARQTFFYKKTFFLFPLTIADRQLEPLKAKFFEILKAGSK